MAYFIPILAALTIACQPTQFLSLELKSETPKSDFPPTLRSVQAQSELTNLQQNGQWREQTLTLKRPGRKSLEILVILDTSQSMNRNLRKLGKRLSPLLSAISDYKWRMAFTTAEHGDRNSLDPWQDHAGSAPLKQTVSIRESFLKTSHQLWRDPKQPYSVLLNRLKNYWQHLGDPFGSFGKLMNLEGPTLIEKRTPDNIIKFQVLKERLLTADMPDYETIFKNTVSHETVKLRFTDETPFCGLPPFCSSNIEQPLRSLKSAMERIHFDNAFFFRPNTDVVALMIANDDVKHSHKYNKVQNPTRAQDVMDTFNRVLRPLNKRLFAFGILPLDEQCLFKEAGGDGFFSARVAELAEQADGGFNISICESDYGPDLQEISEVIKTLVEQPSVEIEESFIPETLQVEFLDGSAIPWQLFGSKLIFSHEPAQDTQIKIYYQTL